MPTKHYYDQIKKLGRMGTDLASAYAMGYNDAYNEYANPDPIKAWDIGKFPSRRSDKPKRKLSAWNKFVKANSKKPRFRMRSGKLNLKKMAVAFRKTPASKKRKR